MESCFNKIFKGKKVLVTGHTGFKGSWLTLWLTQLGAKVAGYSLKPYTNPSLFNVLNLETKINSVIADIRDETKLNQLIQEFQPEIVFHLAAQPLVRLSYSEPKYTYETNIMGTINLYEAIKKVNSVKAVVNVTSDKCYENKEWVYGYRENDPMGGYDPYSSSKGISELVTSAYRNSFFNPKEFGNSHNVALASARAGNVIGGGDWSDDRLISDSVRAISKDETIYIRSPYATRPWQHVLEPLSGYLWLAAQMFNDGVKYSEGWNFGPNDDDVLTVDEVVRQSIECWGKGKYEINADNKLHEAKLLKLDISKARAYLNWKPVYKANQAIEKTIEWYKTFYDNDRNMIDFTLNQINDFVEEAQSLKIKWSKSEKELLCS